jgi:SM-20-related protein
VNQFQDFEGTEVLVALKFLPHNLCSDVCARAQEARRFKSEVLGQHSNYEGHLDEEVRRSWSIVLPKPISDRVYEELLKTKSELERKFNLAIHNLEAPQLLIYREGDYFKLHRDRSNKQEEHPRAISLVLFLNNGAHDSSSDTYQGGQLLLYFQKQGAAVEAFSIRGVQGTLVAFRSDVLHEVKPVTSGERITIVSWFH